MNAHAAFVEHIKTGENETQIREMLSKFEGLYPYLQFIASKHKLDPFDFKVIEAYWLGNELLDSFTREDYQNFLPELEKRGLPQKYSKEAKERMPEGAIPHHTFHVLFVGVGRVTGTVPTNLESMQKCMATWGEVTETGQDTVLVKGPVLLKSEKFILQEKEYQVKYRKEIMQPKKGDHIAMHWGECAHELSPEQLDNLKKYTERVIEAVNSTLSNS